MLGLQNEREWVVFCQRVLEQPGLVTDSRFISNSSRNADREALRAIIEEAFSHLTLEQVVQRLEAANIANARLNDMHDVWRHPQLEARGRWTRVATSVGEIPALRPPVGSEGSISRMDPVPALGEHTGALLAELGFTPETVQALRAGGVVG